MNKGKLFDGVLVLGPTLEIASPFLFHSRGKSLYSGSKEERKVTKAFRIGEGDYKRITEASQALGLNESNFIRQAALSVATSVLVEHRNAQVEQKKEEEIQKLSPKVTSGGRLLTSAEKRSLGIVD